MTGAFPSALDGLDLAGLDSPAPGEHLAHVVQVRPGKERSSLFPHLLVQQSEDHHY